MTTDSSRLIVKDAPHRSSWERWGVQSAAFTYLIVLLAIPLAVIFQDGLKDGLVALWQAISQPTAWSALRLTLWTSALMAMINAVMGTLTAFVLVRYNFPGKALLNAIVDLPLAIPTLVTGVMLVVLYGPQSFIGGWFKNQLGWPIIFAPPGIILALLFINFPFVVRAVQPVLQDLNPESEEAAATLGAGATTIFWRVILPALRLPIISGALLSFARAIGEFGAIVIVSGNIPFRTQTAAVYVFGEVESADRQGASAISIVMLAVAFGLVLFMDLLRRRGQREKPT
ncbi:MAG TPA: sulfate ABC transporter permease subunit CysT [Anaerolineales bacterium]|jgi:sulfate transport system permease protein|nr:sulfate ABC transporter permease subunit CysT [Anaerolineales bacterium]